MCLKYYSIVIFTVSTIINCGTAESNPWQKPSINNDNVGSLLNNPNARRNILNLILQNQGTSVDQIRDKIIAADGNLEEAVNGINSELKENVLVIDGDVLRVTREGLQNILSSLVQSISNKLSSNPSLASVVERSLNQRIAEQLDSLVNRLTVPVDVANQWLNNENDRSKRSLDTRAFDLGTIVSDIVVGVLQDQLIAVVVSALDSVKVLLQGFYIETAPANDIEGLVGATVNWVIKGALQVITSLQQLLTNLGSTTATTSAPVARRRREIPYVPSFYTK